MATYLADMVIVFEPDRIGHGFAVDLNTIGAFQIPDPPGGVLEFDLAMAAADLFITQTDLGSTVSTHQESTIRLDAP